MKFITTITVLFLFVFSGNAQSSFFVDDAENVYKCGPEWVKKYAPGDTEGIIVAGGNGQGSNANQLKNPSAVIVDEKGDVFICDRDNHRIQKWEKGAKTGITVAGGNGAGSAANQLNYPQSILFDPNGRLTVLDRGNKRILQFFEGQQNPTIIFDENVIYPNKDILIYGMVFLNKNELLISTFEYNAEWRGKIIKWNITEQSVSPHIPNNDTKEIFLKETITGELFPGELLLDKYKNLYIRSFETHQILMVAPNTTFAKSIENKGGGGIFLDNKSNLWVDHSNLFSETIDNQQITKIKIQKDPILGQFLTAETIIDGNAPSINNQFQISPGSKFTQDKKGNIYVIETEKDRILKVNADGKSYLVVAGGNGNGSNSNQLNKPKYIYVDDDENIYIADSENSRIQKWLKGSNSGLTLAGGNGAGSKNNQLRYPQKFLLDSIGDLIILDYYNNRIQKWKIGEKEGITIVGGEAIEFFGDKLNQINYPSDIFIDKNDNLFIGDFSKERILKWIPGAKEGALFRKIKSTKEYTSFEIDNNGIIYTTDSYLNVITKWEANSEIGVVILKSPDVKKPEIIRIENNGDLLISNSGNLSLLKYNITTKVVSPIIKIPKTKSDVNQLDNPQSVFLSDSGNLFVFDKGNNRIQKFIKGEKIISASIVENSYRIFVDKKENAYTLSDDGVRKWSFNFPTQSKIVAKPSNPLGIWVSDNEDIYISNYSPMTIEKWSRGLGKIIVREEGFYYPYNLVLGSDSTIYVYNSKSETIQKWDAINKIAITITENKFINDDLSFGNANYYQNLFVDNNNYLYTLDNDKILKWKPNSTIPEYVFGQQIGSNSKLNNPQGFTIAPNGDIYIADTGNNRILKVNPNVKIVEKSASQKTLTEYNGAYFLTQTNDLIAKMIPDEANLAMGEVTISVLVDAEQNESFVKRHYKIETNSPSHKAKITLYFTQKEFDDYNKLNAKKLPISPSDKAGIANIVIGAAKITNNNRILPIQKTIKLSDNQIFWNGDMNIWEITFEDSGSKEYWLKTKPQFSASDRPGPKRPFESSKQSRQGIENESVDKENFVIFPNPVSNNFTLEIKRGGYIGTEADLKNEIGQSVKSIRINKNIEDISVENLPTGLYFIEFFNGANIKFIKK